MAEGYSNTKFWLFVNICHHIWGGGGGGIEVIDLCMMYRKKVNQLQQVSVVHKNNILHISHVASCLVTFESNFE